ncbi:MAG: SAM-dependent methyltransferase [Planctomycetia bacterium]|nr:SAM-dependent methyltransferase [Planctomycetia bacterium]
MQPGRASTTAEFMALFRAIESSLPARERLFEDRFAPLFLRQSLRFVLGLQRVPLCRRAVAALIDARWPGAMSAGIARTRYIDDVVGAALVEGTEQVVILGAGFDCRAYRVPGIDRTRVFEVDHPSTLAEKRRRLAAVLSPPPHVCYVATNFDEQLLAATMAQAGFDLGKRALVIWEGVTNYLTAEAVDQTLRWFAGGAAGSRMVFTYVDRRVLDDPSAFAGTEKLFRTLRRSSEPWTFGLDPLALADFLAGRRLALVSDLAAREFRARYASANYRPATGYEFYHIAEARVPQPAMFGTGTASVGPCGGAFGPTLA